MAVSWFGLEARVSRYRTDFEWSEMILLGAEGNLFFSEMMFKHIRMDKETPRYRSERRTIPDQPSNTTVQRNIIKTA